MYSAPRSRVAVKFSRVVKLPYRSGAERAFAGVHAERWAALHASFSGLTLDPLFSASGELLETAEQYIRARKGAGEPPHLAGWFRVACPADRADALSAAFSKWPDVDEAYVMPEGYPPCSYVAFQDDPVEVSQRFHLPAPTGIDARYAWRHLGSSSGVRVAVVDNGFDFDQADLVREPGFFDSGQVEHSFGVNEPHPDHPEFFLPAHGSAALGLALARDNTIGGVGIAPLAAARACCTLGADRQFHVADAIRAAAGFDGFIPFPAGVIIIEVGKFVRVDDSVTGDRIIAAPAEAESAIFDAIRWAVDVGAVVLEAAGNSDFDLDRVRKGGKAIFDRSSQDFRDSGAIVVSACFSGGNSPRSRISFLDPADNLQKGVNFGSRIDCFAWGDGTSTGLEGAAGFIGNTSAATPIVGGAVSCIQGIVWEHSGALRTPSEIRALFSDATLNTPSADPAVDRIGVMPNLRKILRQGLGIMPATDAVLRDFVGDDGEPHATVALGRSPDIIVRNEELADPQDTLGMAWAAPGMSPSITNPSFVYLRVRNIGRMTANELKADVFWSRVDDVTDTTRWRAIGVAEFPPVASHANRVTVSHPMRWDTAVSGTPGVSGDYMLIGIVRGDGDVVPPLPAAFADRDALRAFVAAHNNIATRSHTLYAIAWRRWLQGIAVRVSDLVSRIWVPEVRLRPPWR